MTVARVVKTISNREISLETGKLAKQANGSVLVQCGKTVILATAVMGKEPRDQIDFLPLTVECIEKMYAAGKIPGGFFKREAKPSTIATLNARLIDRPIRPLFPDGLFNEIQVVVTVLSYDDSIQHEFLAIIAASAALTVSDIPFNGPVGAALISCIDGKLVANPSQADLQRSTLEIIVAGTKDAILMVESQSKEVSEEMIVEALALARKTIRESVELQEELHQQFHKEKKMEVISQKDLSALTADIDAFLGDKIEKNLRKGNKKETEEFLESLKKEVLEKFISTETDNSFDIKTIYEELKKKHIRETVIKEKIRPDGRALTQIRPINSELGILPAVHGSAVFTRGETQSLGVVTLGTSDDEQIEDGLKTTNKKRYYFHYNFPPYSVGEIGRFSGTGRRELGHGALAERALKAVLPEYDDFPYTIRVVSEILESNGSSSMASVCSGSLALMDAGVPIKSAVSGIAMGLMIDKDDYIILSDIQGLEDHYGDMDFKVAGTPNGITALQLDIKVEGLTEEILTKALYQAKEGRMHIMGEMNKALNAPRTEVSSEAPKIEFISINPEKVGLLIGPGGKMIKRLEEETGATIIVTDGTTGQVSIAAKNKEALDRTKNMIQVLVKDVEVGDIYEGKVVKITTFGAFIELVPGKEGLLHISKISKERVNRVEDVLSVGELIEVQVKEIDNQHRVNLVPVNLKD